MSLQMVLCKAHALLKVEDLGACPQGNFSKVNYVGTLRLNFLAILIIKTYQLTGCSTFKISLLVVAHSVCIPAVTIYIHNNHYYYYYY